MPRLSSIGRQAARIADDMFSTASSSTLVPINASAASDTNNAVAATAPRPTLAATQTPFESSDKLAAKKVARLEIVGLAV